MDGPVPHLEDDIANDLLFGAAAVGVAMGLSKRQVYHASRIGSIPLFKIGGTICARKISLLRWLDKQEARGILREGSEDRDNPPSIT